MSDSSEYRVVNAHGLPVTGTFDAAHGAERRIAYLLRHGIGDPPFSIEHRSVGDWEAL